MGRNNYFQFKQFIIHQGNTAMKVGTDGVILGAWVTLEGVKTVLDAGTGTGLIALMVAQRCDAFITAIDIEVSACQEARKNVNLSPWKERIEISERSLQDYSIETSLSFDCVVCNPPYFTNSFRPDDLKRSLARHNDQLPFAILIEGVSRILRPEGHFSVILPFECEREFRMLSANYRLFPKRITRVKPKPSASVSRVLMELRFEALLQKEDELIIETEKHHEYQPEFIELVKDFYLKL